MYFGYDEIFENYPDFFTEEAYADYYGPGSPFLLDPVSRDKQESERHVDFILNRLKLQGGERILDMGCGFGRLTLPLARRGFHLSGLDLSEYMLDLAREDAKAEGLAIDFGFCGLEEIPYWEEFDAAISTWNSFGYHEDEEGWLEIVENAFQALKPGGLFFLDVPNRLYEFDKMVFHQEFTRNGAKIVVDRMGDTAQNRINEKHAVTRGDQTTRYGVSYLVFTPGEVESMLRGVGFEIVDRAGDWDGRLLDEDSPRILITAVKTHKIV